MKISVIVPIFNAEKSISKCIDSLLVQTYIDYELLLIDDGSTDNSNKICDEYAEKDNRIKVFHKRNGGVSSARNFGIENASGEWIVFIDSDDWVDNDYLNIFFRNKIDKNVIVILGRIDESPKSQVRCEFRETRLIKEDMAQGIINNHLLEFGAPYCKLYNKDIIIDNGIRFPENYSYGEDAMFFYQYLQYVDEINLRSYCGYHYVNSGENSLSRKFHKYSQLLQFANDSAKAIASLDVHLGANAKLKKYFQINYLNLIKKTIISVYKGNCRDVQKKSFFEELKHLQKRIDGILGFMPKGVLYRIVPSIALCTLYKIVFKIKK